MSIGPWQIIIIFTLFLIPTVIGIAMDRGNQRLNRLSYSVRVILFFIVFITSNLLYGVGAGSPGSDATIALAITTALLITAAMSFLVKFTCQRLRDIGHSRWPLICFAFPIVNLLFLLYALLRPGKGNSQEITADGIKIPENFNLTSNTSTRSDFLSTVSAFMRLAAIIGYFGLGLLQIGAIYAGVGYWLDWHWILNSFIAVFLAYIPIFGTIAGVSGAVYGWGWSLAEALFLFFGVFGGIIIFSIISSSLAQRRSPTY